MMKLCVMNWNNSWFNNFSLVYLKYKNAIKPTKLFTYSIKGLNLKNPRNCVVWVVSGGKTWQPARKASAWISTFFFFLQQVTQKKTRECWLSEQITLPNHRNQNRIRKKKITIIFIFYLALEEKRQIRVRYCCPEPYQ